MPKPKINLRPLTDRGVDFRGASHERKYSDLQNTIPHKGNIRKRPGLRTYGPYIHSATWKEGVPQALIEVDTYADTLAKERLYPDGTVNNSTWTIVGAATVHEALDDDPPDDDTTYVHTSTDSDFFTVSFGNPSNAPDAVYGIVVGGRARNGSWGGGNTPMTVRSFNGSTYETLDTVNVTGYNRDELDVWNDFAIASYLNPHTDEPWTPTELNNMRISILRNASTEHGSDMPNLDANGAHTDWNASSTAWQNVDTQPTTNVNCPAVFWGGREDSDEWIDGTSATNGDKQSVSCAATPLSYTSVTSVTVWYQLDAIRGGWANVQPFFRSGGVDYDIGSGPYRISRVGTDTPQSILIELTTDPSTGAAWQDADVNNLEFGLEFIDGNGGAPYWTNINVAVSGLLSVALHVTNLWVDFIALDSATRRIKDQLIVSSEGIERVASQGTAQLTDVTNSITWSGFDPKKCDWGYLNGQVFITNGMNQIAYYPDGSDLFTQLSAKPYGGTITDIAGRMMLGDATESSTRNKDRLRWSDIEDITDWSSSLSGDLDVHDTQGAWLKLKKLLGTVVGYKEHGIYEIRVTPEVTQPFRHYLRDPIVSCVAPGTVCDTTLVSGQVVHLFLGRGSAGYNVYQYDGNVATPIASELVDEFKDTIDAANVQWSFGVVCPRLQCYMLFLVESDEGFFPDQAWVYHIPTSTWRKWQFSRQYSCAGVWTVPTNDQLDNTGATPFGTPQAVVAGTDGFVYNFDDDYHADEIEAGYWRDSAVVKSGNDFTDGDTNSGRTEPIVFRIDTGELYDPELRKIAAARVHMYYRDRGPAFLSFQTSIDGGVTFTDHRTINIGATNSGDLMKVEVGLEDIQSDRFRLRITNAATAFPEIGSYMDAVDIEDIIIEIDVGGHGI